MLAGLITLWATGSGLLAPDADPEEVIRANNHGVARMEQFKHAQAIEEFKRVTRLAPRWAPGFVNLGLAALYIRDNERAERALRRAIELDPNLVHAHYSLAILLRDLGRSDEAASRMERARALAPGDPHILYNMGLLRVRQRKFKEAIRILRKARLLDPNSMSIRYQLARALLQSGERAAGEKEMVAYQNLASDTRFSVPTGNQYGEAGQYAMVLTDYAGFGGPPPPPAAVTVQFRDVTEGSGISFVHAGPGGEIGSAADRGDDAAGATAVRYGSGMAIGDFDADGRPDLVFANASSDGKARPALYRNRGDLKFEDVTQRSRVVLQGIGMAVTLADYDNDGDLDLFFTHLGGGTLYRNDGSGVFEDVTKSASINLSGFCLGASWADVDHDGDLDLYVLRVPEQGTSAPVSARLLLNRGDGTFRDDTERLHLGGPAGGAIGAVFSDLDLDRDIDVVLSVPGGRDVVLENRRDDGFADRGAAIGLAQHGGGRGVTAGDIDGDGRTDLIFADRTPGVLRAYMNTDGGGFEAREIDSGVPGSIYGTVLFDADNDGDLDLFATGEIHRYYRNLGDGTFEDEAAGAGLHDLPAGDGRAVATADLDADGDLDLVVTRNGGRPILLRNDGGNRHSWIRVRPRGRSSNRDGIGTKIEVQAGAFWQRREVQAGSGYLSQSPATAHFGLRDRGVSDVVRLLWPGGVLQAELDVPGGQDVDQIELDRKGSSCPLLFTWDGMRYRFVADFLGVGGLGLWLGPGVYGRPDSDEYIKIEPHELAPLDGAYYLQIVENLEEVTYLDEARLIAIDHPKSIDVYPNERFPVEDEPEHRLYGVRRSKRIFPVRVTAHNGRDVTDRLMKIDRIYPDDFPLRRLAGYADMHTLEIEFPPAITKRDDLVLFLYGWVDFEYSSSNFAAAQSGIVLTPPILEVQNDALLYAPVMEPMGFPPGLPRMMTVDLSEIDPLITPRIRLRTNMRVYWDQIFLAAPIPLDEMDRIIKVNVIRASGAHLHRRGYPREHSPDRREPKIYDYSIMDNTMPFKVMTGDYTRFGAVTQLVRRTDDKFVIFGKGEEVTLEFPVKNLPDVPHRHVRSFLLFATGFCKDMDPHTAFGETVEPLPFHGMSGYPYGENEVYPDDADHRAYRKIYNTRHLQGR
ncbi:MAG: FG-GAP-like repeat-containing protein [Acidobacteria bacterium]|nr:FG-GAP-like repeat-containing protein [Acidobacteriota bacterium]